MNPRLSLAHYATLMHSLDDDDVELKRQRIVGDLLTGTERVECLTRPLRPVLVVHVNAEVPRGARTCRGTAVVNVRVYIITDSRTSHLIALPSPQE